MAGNLSAKWNVTAHLQLQMSRMEAAIQEITQEVGQAKEALEKEIGERKELESQLVQTEKLASIGHLAAGVAHEINNPISYVSSNYTTLEEHVRRLLEVLEAYEEARPRSATRRWQDAWSSSASGSNWPSSRRMSLCCCANPGRE